MGDDIETMQMRIEIGELLPTYHDMMMDGVEEISRPIQIQSRNGIQFQSVLAPIVLLTDIACIRPAYT